MITIKTLLEKAAEHLLTGELGFDTEELRCSYRVGEEAKSPGRCFIGALIPDEYYKPRFDSDNWPAIDILDELIRAGAEAEHHRVDDDFANELQMIHDNIFLDVNDARQLHLDAGSPRRKAGAAGELIDLAAQHNIELDPDLRARLTDLKATYPV